MIQCPKCQNDNDLGRIFCAKCGEKLDISKVAPPSGIRKRKKKGNSAPLSLIITNEAIKFVKVLLLASASALILLIWMQPVAHRKKIDASLIPAYQEKRKQLEEAMGTQQTLSLVFDEAELNAKLDETVQNTLKGLPEGNGARLESIYVHLGQGNVLMTAENKWKWFRLAVQVQAKAVRVNGKWKFQTEWIRIGRLLIPSQLNDKIMDSFVTKLWKDFDQEKQWLADVASLEIKSGQASILTWTESSDQ